MRGIVLALTAIVLSACAIQRAQEAQDAHTQMVGMSKEQVLACMGPAINKAAEGGTEVWTYNSGNRMTISGGSVSGGSFSATSSSRFCTVNVVMTKAKSRPSIIPGQQAVFSLRVSNALMPSMLA
jgi:hypothetical protein